MSEQLKHALVRILRLKDDKWCVCGSGFLTRERYIVTCVHVVADSLEIPRNQTDSPGKIVFLDFPFRAEGIIVPAKVIYWGISTGDPNNDIAILELQGGVPSGCQSLAIYNIQPETFQGHYYSAYGFPYRNDKGDWSYGLIHHDTVNGLIQVEQSKGCLIEQGFSGTPLWVDSLGKVAGIVAKVDEGSPNRKTSFIISSQTITIVLLGLGIVADELISSNSFRYACFISIPSIQGANAVRMQKLIDLLSPEIENELGNVSVFMDRARLQSRYDKASAVHLCDSACMVMVYTPDYFQTDFCVREYYAMENLERERLGAVGIDRIDEQSSLIIPVIYRNKRDLPSYVRQQRGDRYDFEDWMLKGNLSNSTAFLKEIKDLARRIAEKYRLLENCPILKIRDCSHYNFPSKDEIKPWLPRLGNRSIIGGTCSVPFVLHEVM